MIQDHRLATKEAFLEYLGEVPVYKWAAKAVKKSRDTMEDWRREDPDFALQCELKLAEWVKKTTRRARPEFQLERLMREDFKPPKTESDVTLITPAPILGGQSKPDALPTNDSNTKAAETPKEN